MPKWLNRINIAALAAVGAVVFFLGYPFFEDEPSPVEGSDPSSGEPIAVSPSGRYLVAVNPDLLSYLAAEELESANFSANSSEPPIRTLREIFFGNETKAPSLKSDVERRILGRVIRNLGCGEKSFDLGLGNLLICASPTPPLAPQALGYPDSDLIKGIIPDRFIPLADVNSYGPSIPSPAALQGENQFYAAAQEIPVLTPNDPLFTQQWALNQASNVDIDAPEVWAIERGSQVPIVAVLDTGVNFELSELKPNIFQFPRKWGEVDVPEQLIGLHGFDATNLDEAREPLDTNGRGTKIAAAIAAKGNNGVGTTGVAQTGLIFPIKIVRDGEQGPLLIDWAVGVYLAIDFVALAIDLDVNAIFLGITPTSLGECGRTTIGSDTETTIAALVDEFRELPHLFVIPAGDNGINIDTVPTFMQCTERDQLPTEDNFLVVGGVNKNGELATRANYGLNTVDIAAPGQDILTPDLDGQSYSLSSGSALAAAHALGVAILYNSRFGESYGTRQKQRLAEGVKSLPVLDGKVKTGGLLSAVRALKPEAIDIGGVGLPKLDFNYFTSFVRTTGLRSFRLTLSVWNHGLGAADAVPVVIKAYSSGAELWRGSVSHINPLYMSILTADVAMPEGADLPREIRILIDPNNSIKEQGEESTSPYVHELILPIDPSSTAAGMTLTGSYAGLIGAPIAIHVQAEGSAGETFSYYAEGLPRGATFNNQDFYWIPRRIDTDGSIDGTPGTSEFPVKFLARNNNTGNTLERSVTLRVKNPVAPTLVFKEDWVTQTGQALTVGIRANFPARDAVPIYLSGLPPSARFVQTTSQDLSLTEGTLTWTPGQGDATEWSFPVFVAASGGQAAGRLTIMVNYPPGTGAFWLPDLKPIRGGRAIRWTDSDEVEVSAVLGNQGQNSNFPANNVLVGVLPSATSANIYNTFLGTSVITHLRSPSETEWSTSINVPIGTQSLTVTMDPLNLIDESDETNNSFSVEIRNNRAPLISAGSFWSNGPITCSLPSDPSQRAGGVCDVLICVDEFYSAQPPTIDWEKSNLPGELKPVNFLSDGESRNQYRYEPAKMLFFAKDILKYNYPGTREWTIRARCSDGHKTTIADVPFKINYAPPTFSASMPTAVSMFAGQIIITPISASPGKPWQSLSFRAENLPPWAAFDQTKKQITWTAPRSQFSTLSRSPNPGPSFVPLSGESVIVASDGMGETRKVIKWEIDIVQKPSPKPRPKPRPVIHPR